MNVEKLLKYINDMLKNNNISLKSDVRTVSFPKGKRSSSKKIDCLNIDNNILEICTD